MLQQLRSTVPFQRISIQTFLHECLTLNAERVRPLRRVLSVADMKQGLKRRLEIALVPWSLRCRHLNNAAASAPNVNLGVVLSRCEHLRRSPQRCRLKIHVDGVIVVVVLVENGGTKVCNLDHAAIIDQNVLALDIAMNNVLGVRVVQSLHQLVHIFLNHALGEAALLGVDRLNRVAIHILHHHLDDALVHVELVVIKQHNIRML
mmetsp:Transcript_25082/g.40705  ORF Transcript_25082/g.40705 Transcript_25082/m.40705 type:complete len:205 (+) Transcript_25082:170-784(+)